MRKQACNNITVPAADNMTGEQKNSIFNYIRNSDEINSYLRGNQKNPAYPQPDMIPGVQNKTDNIGTAIQNNPLQENLTAYARGRIPTPASWSWTCRLRKRA